MPGFKTDTVSDLNQQGEGRDNARKFVFSITTLQEPMKDSFLLTEGALLDVW